MQLLRPLLWMFRQPHKPAEPRVNLQVPPLLFTSLFICGDFSLSLSLQTSQLATKCSGLLWSRFLWVRPVHLSHAWDCHRAILPVRRHVLWQVRLWNVCFLLFISYLTSCSSDSWHFYIFGVSDFNSDHSDQPDHFSDRHLGSCAVVGVTANVENASRNIAKKCFFTWRDVAEIFFPNIFHVARCVRNIFCQLPFSSGALQAGQVLLVTARYIISKLIS